MLESLACGTSMVTTDVGGNPSTWCWQVSMIYGMRMSNYNFFGDLAY